MPNSLLPPDGGYGWIIIFACVLINITLLTLVQTFGIIYNDEFKTLGVSSSETSLLLHLHSAIFCSLGLISSPLLKKYPFRNVAFLGTMLMCFGILLSSFHISYWYLIFTVSILIGVGQGILMPATYLATNTYFKNRLTLAVSLSITSASISSIFMPQLCNFLKGNFGTRGTVLVLFAISLLGLVGCALLKPLRKISDINDENEVNEKLTGENCTLQDGSLNKRNQSDLLERPYKETTIRLKCQDESWHKKIYSLLDLELLKNRSFLLVILCMAISSAAELNIIVMIQFVLPQIAHFSPADVAMAQSIQSMADIFGRLVVPFLSYKLNVSPRIMYSLSLIVSTFGRTCLAIFSSTRYMVFCCSILFGFGKGIKAIFQSVIIPKCVPLEKLPAANGLNMVFTGVSFLLLGPFIGFIGDVTNSYKYALHTASFISMLCIGTWLVEYYITTKSNKVTNNNAVNK